MSSKKIARQTYRSTETVQPQELFLELVSVLAGTRPELLVEVPPDVLRLPAYQVTVRPRHANFGLLPILTPRTEEQSEDSQAMSAKRAPRARKKSLSPKHRQKNQ